MTQSAFIAAALLAAFVMYLAVKGRLKTYASVLWGPSGSGVATGSAAGMGAEASAKAATMPSGQVWNHLSSWQDLLNYAKNADVGG